MKYTISTKVFDTKEEALDMLGRYREWGMLNPESKVFEVSKIYDVKLSLDEHKETKMFFADVSETKGSLLCSF